MHSKPGGGGGGGGGGGWEDRGDRMGTEGMRGHTDVNHNTWM